MNNQQETPHDIYTDPALAQAKEEDPFFGYIANNWRQLLVTAVVIFGGYYIYTRYQQAQNLSFIAAADLLVKVQETSKELTELQSKLITLNQPQVGEKEDVKKGTDLAKEKEALQKQVDETKEKFSQRLAALSDAREPYGNLANLYRGLNASKSGDIASLKSAVGAVNDQLSDSNDDGSVLVQELATLMLARSLLDNADTYIEGRDQLKTLATEGKFVHSSAAQTLARVSATDEEKQDALSIIDQIISTHPGQSDILKEEKERLQ